MFWYLPRFTDSALSAATLSASTAIAASVTIAHRMALMATPSGFDAAGQREALRMVSEKLAAATEGSFEAAIETGRFMMRSALGQVSPDDVAHGLMAIGVAAAEPAARTVKANARRLTRR